MNLDSIGVYIHIPFCVRKCRYCDFPSFGGKNDIDSYFKALFSEIHNEGETEGRTADSVYIGGGTPSLVPPFFIRELMDILRKKYVIGENAEISMEMNPGTIDSEALKVYFEAGINRVSLGCQSFNDRSLMRLGRIHSSADAIKTYDMLRKQGFNNINLDLMSGLPGEEAGDMERSLYKALELGPEHLSVYSLIIEPGTEFHRMYEEGELEDLPSEEELEETDRMIRSILEKNGYMRYEISNYARSGRECVHNIRYWTRGEYRGYGLSAASLIGNRRFTNTRDLVYINQPGAALQEDRILSREEEMQEFMFLGLRMVSGVSSRDFRDCFGEDIGKIYGKQLEDQIKNGFMEYDGERYRYNDRGLDVSNRLMSEFL